MSLFKFMIAGAAVAYGINHITKKRANGTSIMDDWAENAPEWMEKAKRYTEQTIDQVAENIRQHNAASRHSEPL